MIVEQITPILPTTKTQLIPTNYKSIIIKKKKKIICFTTLTVKTFTDSICTCNKIHNTRRWEPRQHVYYKMMNQSHDSHLVLVTLYVTESEPGKESRMPWCAGYKWGIVHTSMMDNMICNILLSICPNVIIEFEFGSTQIILDYHESFQCINE